MKLLKRLILTKEQLFPDEVIEAIDFLHENPSADAYVNQNFKNFMNHGEVDDNSIELSAEWDENLSTLFLWALNLKVKYYEEADKRYVR